MQWNRRQDFCTPFSSGHIPANIPCPVLGDPVDSSPGLLPVLGWAEAEAEWEAAKAAPQDIQSELALSEQSLLGGRRKRHWVSTALCGPWQPRLNPAAIVQTSVWTSGIRVLTGVSKTLLSTGSPLWQSHSSIQTPPQGSSNYVTHKGCQSVVSPLMEQPTHICRHSGRLPQEALCYVSPFSIIRFKGDAQTSNPSRIIHSMVWKRLRALCAVGGEAILAQHWETGLV